jgi:hypothetical protein
MPMRRRLAPLAFGLALPFMAPPAVANAPRQPEAARTAQARPAATPARPPGAAQPRQVAARAPAAVAAPVVVASLDPWSACAQAIAGAEANSGLPPGLLGAIARVETGRRAPGGGVQPWPWSYNAAGEGRYASTRVEAVAEVQALQARGVRSIDIGCMQINLLHHPDAFPSVDAGFDPAANVAYAVRFLRALHARTGDWATATAQYHSATPERGAIYHQRVMTAMTGQGFMPGPAPGVIPLPGPQMAGLCASGRGAVLLLGSREPNLRPIVGAPSVELRLRGAPPAAGPARPRIMCLRTSSRTAPG